MARPVAVPIALSQVDARTLAIDWSDGHKSRYEVRALRLACACAHCVQEWTGEVMVKPEQIAADVHPLAIEPVGSYGLRVDWSDGHGSGIYTFERLRGLCQCVACAGKKP